jgi:hypothetical protein
LFQMGAIGSAKVGVCAFILIGCVTSDCSSGCFSTWDRQVWLSSLAVSGLVVSGLAVSSLVVSGLASVLVVSGLVVSGLFVSGLVVSGLEVSGLCVSGLVLCDMFQPNVEIALVQCGYRLARVHQIPNVVVIRGHLSTRERAN